MIGIAMGTTAPFEFEVNTSEQELENEDTLTIKIKIRSKKSENYIKQIGEIVVKLSNLLESTEKSMWIPLYGQKTGSKDEITN
jgi:hypothetical protein